jgi:preprotein translocase subunit SecG
VEELLSQGAARGAWRSGRCARLTGDCPVSYTEKNAMFILLTIVHVVVCIFLIIVVLLQSGKAADLAGAFGGMGSQTAFGPRGSATLLSKATTVSAIVFMITSLSLSILATRTSGVGKTVLDGAKQSAPAKPAPAPAAPSQNAPAQPAKK